MSTDLSPVRRASALRVVVPPWHSPSVRQGLRARLTTMPVLLTGVDVAAVLIAAIALRVPLWLGPTALVVVLASTSVAGLYRPRLSLSLLDQLPKLLLTDAVIGGLLLSAAVAVSAPANATLRYVVLLVFVMFVGRNGAYVLARHLRRSSYISHSTLVLGTTRYGRRIVDVLQSHPEYGLEPLGYLAEPDEDRAGLPLPVLGRVADLARLVEERNVRVAVLAYEDVPDGELVSLLRSCHRLRCELFLIPAFAELHSVTDATEMVWGVPVVRLRRAAHRTPTWRLKRGMDFLLAAAALTCLAPLMAALALAVRLEGGPGIIFRQVRVGIDGNEFDLMKFRSLRPVDDDESATNWNISRDDRVGRVGKLIRRTSLDELPQLVNILRGDMSLVGPRPERPHFVKQFSSLYPSYSARDRVPCGLTGWAQVHGLRGDTSIDERAEFDNFYIENWSLWLDVKIMLRTVVSVFSAPGA